jgi:hypothetical protein
MDDSGRPQLEFPEFYRPLAPNFTRVFELEAGNFSDPIIGRLVPQTVDAEPYEAISYVWGSSKTKREITINGTRISITENLHAALTALRHPPVRDDSNQPGSEAILSQRQPVRRLWADAICINQGDLAERVSQVEMMSLIYAGATRVLSWLGWEDIDKGCRLKQEAMDFIRTFMEDPEAGLRDSRIILHHDASSSLEDSNTLSEDDKRRFEDQTRKWAAVKYFFEIEYFHRAWVVQELGLAREALLVTALKPQENNPAVEMADSPFEVMVARGKAPDLEVATIEWPLIGQFVELCDYQAASLVTHLDLLLWVAHHIVMVWATKADGTPNCDFLTGMHWARILKVTDPRDRAFSLLGHPLAVLDNELVVHPDYTRTRGVIYTKLAVNVIRKTKNLYILSLVDHEVDPSLEQLRWDPQCEKRMPTWVPDWHSINRTTPFDYAIPAADIHDDDISFADGTTCEDGTLLPLLSVRGWIIDKVSAVSHRMETTDFPVTHLTRECAKKNPFWLDRVWELVRPAEKQCDSPKSSCDDVLAVLDSLSLSISLGTQGEDGWVCKAGSSQTLEEHHRSFAAYVLEYHKLLQTALAESCPVKLKDNKATFPARSIYDSLPVEAQAVLQRRAKGATSGGFLECMVWPSMCRVVYRTETGLVGMGSRITRIGDLICRVRGSNDMMTLRDVAATSPRLATEPGIETEEPPAIRCVYIGPTVLPARVKRGVVDGAIFGERSATFQII